MVTENKKDFLATSNELSHERYVDCVNEEGKDKYPFEEENAILRKMLAEWVFEQLRLFPDLQHVAPYKEFLEYYNYFENAKKQNKRRLGIPIGDNSHAI